MATDTKTANDTELLRKDLQELRSDLEKLSKDVATVSASLAGQLRNRAGATAANLRDSAEQIANDLSARSAESAKVVEKKVRENPFQSVLISFGIGLLLSQMFNRR